MPIADHDQTLSSKVKDFLTRKLEDKQMNIKKLKRKRKIVKVLYYSTTISSIVISAILASMSTIISIPPIYITILATTSAILTTISTKFNFKDKNNQLSRDIEKLDKLNNRLDYVISTNGNMTNEEYSQILSEFK